MATKAVERVLTDHDEIRKMGGGARPTCVNGTEASDGPCLLRLDLPKPSYFNKLVSREPTAASHSTET